VASQKPLFPEAAKMVIPTAAPLAAAAVMAGDAESQVLV
jgi:hypothetical protein